MDRRKRNELFRSIKKYGFNSLFVRNAARVLLLFLVPILIVLGWMFYYGGNIVDSKLDESNLRNLYRAQVMVDMLLTEAVSFTENLYANNDVNKLVNRIHDTYPNYNDIALRNKITTLLGYNNTEYIQSVYIYSALNNCVLTTGAAGPPKYFADIAWLDVIGEKDSGNLTPFFALTARSGSSPGISYFRPLRREHADKGSYVVVNFNQAKLDELLQDLHSQSPQNLIVANARGDILYATAPAWTGMALGAVLPEVNVEKANFEARQLVAGADGEKYVCHVVPSDLNGWRYLSAMRHADFAKGLSSFYTSSVVMIAVCVLLSLICTILIAAEACEPISIVKNVLGDPMRFSSKQIRNKELQFILGTIYSSYGKGATNRQDVERHIEMLKQANISALQAQINPHFLYNTLQAISFTFIKETGNSEAKSVELLEDLASLIRDTTEVSRTMVTLDDEIGYITKYLQLQKGRYGEKLAYQMDIPEEARQLMLPKMCLQPLLENAFKHGVSFKHGGGRIWICASLDEEHLMIRVEDNGGAVRQAVIDEVNDRLKKSGTLADKHIGLINVKTRLNLIYEARADLWLETGDAGMVAVLKIPIKKAI